MARRGLVAGAALLIAAALWAATGAPHAPPPAPASTPNGDAEAARAQSRSAADRRAEIVAALRGATVPDGAGEAEPGSLRGTDIDGALAVDADGRLVVTPAVRRLFEYFFVASGEEEDRQIRSRIETEIRARLDGEARQTAFDLLDRYIAYRARGRIVAATAAAETDLVRRIEVLRRLRIEVFGERDAAALFADEDSAYTVVIAQRRIMTDASLSDAERDAQVGALEARLPPELREARAAVTAPLRLAREEAALRDAGGSPAEVQALREAAVGRDAAERLAALDERRAEWLGRVSTYREERAAIDADASLDSEQREAALDALRTRHFTAEEIARVRALDRIDAAAP